MSTQLAIKHDAGKVRYELLPPGPLKEVAKVFTFGAQKYADRNWEKGMPWSKCFGAAQRHLWDFWDGKDINEEDFGLHHLAHAIAELFFVLEYVSTHPELDDRPRNPQNIQILNHVEHDRKVPRREEGDPTISINPLPGLP